MIASTKPRRSRSRALTDSLEVRCLFSGWTTADSVAAVAVVNSMAADATGNIYAAGSLGSAGLLREKAAGSAGFVSIAAPAASNYTAVAVDSAGDLFLTDGPHIFERAVGQSSFKSLNVTLPSGAVWTLSNGGQTFAVDAAGDVFAAGEVSLPTTTTTTVKGKPQTTTTYTSCGAIFEMKAGQTTFGLAYRDPNDPHAAKSFEPWSLTVINTGPSAGLYSVDGTGYWTVRKSTDGGASWSVIDDFDYDPSVFEGSIAYSVVGDSTGTTGNLYVTGSAEQRVITGYYTTKVKGVPVVRPVYRFDEHWLTRRSTDGGATWTNVDDFQQSVTGVNEPQVAADLNGTVYVAGVVYTGDITPGVQAAAVRSNAGGAWHTEDFFANAQNYAVAIDPVTATPYAGGQTNSGAWFVRSGTPATSLATSATFSSTAIGITSKSLLDLISPSTNLLA